MKQLGSVLLNMSMRGLNDDLKGCMAKLIANFHNMNYNVINNKTGHSQVQFIKFMENIFLVLKKIKFKVISVVD